MKNKIIKFYILIFAIAGSLLFANSTISSFVAQDGGNKVILKWTSTTETDVDCYEIERSLDLRNFTKIGKVAAQGPSDYTYVDKAVFKLNTTQFYYRLRIVNTGGANQIYWKTISVKPNISGIKHTWGSLKAMFR